MQFGEIFIGNAQKDILLNVVIICIFAFAPKSTAWTKL